VTTEKGGVSYLINLRNLALLVADAPTPALNLFYAGPKPLVDGITELLLNPVQPCATMDTTQPSDSAPKRTAGRHLGSNDVSQQDCLSCRLIGEFALLVLLSKFANLAQVLERSSDSGSTATSRAPCR
jgi:hypothetical protein